MALNLTSALNQVTANVDMNKGSKGGERHIPEAGKCPATLVGYIEVGKQKETTGQFAGKINDRIILVFELAGKKHPVSDINGEKVPERLSITVNKSLHIKSKLFQIFARMNSGDNKKHMAEFLGKHFLLEVVHQTSKAGRKYAKINPDSIQQPKTVNAEGDEVAIPAPEFVSEIRAFLWDAPDKEQWDSIYIAGEYPARTDDEGNVVSPARSKNRFQEEIKAAENYEGSAIQVLLETPNLGKDTEPETVISDDEISF